METKNQIIIALRPELGSAAIETLNELLIRQAGRLERPFFWNKTNLAAEADRINTGNQWENKITADDLARECPEVYEVGVLKISNGILMAATDERAGVLQKVVEVLALAGNRARYIDDSRSKGLDPKYYLRCLTYARATLEFRKETKLGGQYHG